MPSSLYYFSYSNKFIFQNSNFSFAFVCSNMIIHSLSEPLCTPIKKQLPYFPYAWLTSTCLTPLNFPTWVIPFWDVPTCRELRCLCNDSCVLWASSSLFQGKISVTRPWEVGFHIASPLSFLSSVHCYLPGGLSQFPKENCSTPFVSQHHLGSPTTHFIAF